MQGVLSSAIDKAYDKEPSGTYRSTRIGASIVGDPCEAFLAFTIRGFPENRNTPRLKRIFRDGHRIETAVIADLRKAGFAVTEKDPFTGKQYEWQAYGNHMVFKADGLIEINGELMILEVKSMNNARWKKFKDRGLKVSDRRYFDQLQLGMGMSKFEKSVLISYNKNTSEYHDQVIEFDEIAYRPLLVPAESVLNNNASKIATDKADWRCKDCFKRGVCWEGQDVPKDMRTCNNAVLTNAGWQCPLCPGGVCQSWTRYEPKART